MTEWAIVRLHRLADRAEDLASYLERRLRAADTASLPNRITED